MSTAIYWEPAARKKERVGNLTLKKALQKRYGYPCHCRLDHCDIPFLEGVDAADQDSHAVKLIIAINKHGSITVTEEE